MPTKRTEKSAFPRRSTPRRPTVAGLLRLTIIGAMGLALSWEVISRGAAAYFADVAPQMALWLNSQQPTALINAADRLLNLPEEAERSTSGALNDVAKRQILRWAELAVMNEPVNARASRILGQLADSADDRAHAAQFMETAVHFSLRESAAAYWMMKRRMETHNYDEVMYYADVILRTHPELGIYVVPTLAQIAENKQADGLLKALLAGNPPWRKQFLTSLPGNATDVRTPLDMLLALRTTAVPPTSAEIGPYLTFLIDRNSFELAYYTWLQFLPPELLNNVRPLFNGDFEIPLSGEPFDWVITPGSGVTVDIVQRSDGPGGHALLVQFQYGRVEFHAVTQLVLLSPGTYKFVGKDKGELVGPRGLRWSVRCADGMAAPLGEWSTTGSELSWKNFEFSFTVPEVNCRAQYVRLDLAARMASERLVSGSVLFDELEIVRLADPPM